MNSALRLPAAFLLRNLTAPHNRASNPANASAKSRLAAISLDDAPLGKANLLDLTGAHTSFTPDPTGYRVENTSLKWDADFGAELTAAEVQLHYFRFPFSGKSDTLSGSLRFGPAQAATGGRGGGIPIGRFDQLQEAAHTLVNTVPAICVFLNPRMSGRRYFKELGSRAVITRRLIGSVRHATMCEHRWPLKSASARLATSQFSISAAAWWPAWKGSGF